MAVRVVSMRCLVGAKMTPLFAFLAATLLLPLFPFSILLVAFFERVNVGRLRAPILLVIFMPGAALLTIADGPPPAWMLAWAMLTAVLYAWRAIALQDVRLWVVFLVVSSGALLWAGAGHDNLILKALGFGLPLATMSMLVDLIERRFGAAHIALELRLATLAPKLSGLFVVALLAAIAMPVSPSFFAMIALVVDQASTSVPTTLAILGCWLLWSWSAARIFAGIAVGPRHTRTQDIADSLALLHAAVFVGLGLIGVLLGALML